MAKHRLVLLLSMYLCVSCYGEADSLRSTLSPKLRVFLDNHPAAYGIMTNAFFEAFSNRTAALYYFYSNDDTLARAYHFYPNTVSLTEVVICIHESQKPLDEYLLLLYEIQNSKNEKRFEKLVESARSGTISRTDFAMEVLRIEFDATKSVRDVIITLMLSKKEKSESRDYVPFVNCPSEFVEYLSYIKKLSNKRDVVKEYEIKYDLLRSPH